MGSCVQLGVRLVKTDMTVVADTQNHGINTAHSCNFFVISVCHAFDIIADTLRDVGVFRL